MHPAAHQWIMDTRTSTDRPASMSAFWVAVAGVGILLGLAVWVIADPRRTPDGRTLVAWITAVVVIVAARRAASTPSE